MIYIKSSYDIECIKAAATIYKKVKVALTQAVKPGISLITLDNLANEIIEANGATAAFYQYRHFPKHICISVNQQLIHGVPSEYVIQPGDLVTFDVGVKYRNHFCDAAFNVLIPPASTAAKKIVDATEISLANAIKIIRDGIYTNDIGSIINQTAKQYHYEVIKDYGGHGCGNKLHEDPIVYNYETNLPQTQLKTDMIICIEPMLMTASDQYDIDPVNH
jgi:methionyl aminopeptidase